jgi:hypothetical protein
MTKLRIVLLCLAGGSVVTLLLMRPWELSIAELSFPDDHSGVATAIETGWLPEWFPATARNIQGAQRTFDDSFIWITFTIRGNPAAPDFLNANCRPIQLELANMPDAAFIQKFPDHVRSTYKALQEERRQASYYACPDDRREYFLARIGSRPPYYLWAY